MKKVCLSGSMGRSGLSLTLPTFEQQIIFHFLSSPISAEALSDRVTFDSIEWRWSIFKDRSVSEPLEAWTLAKCTVCASVRESGNERGVELLKHFLCQACRRRQKKSERKFFQCSIYRFSNFLFFLLLLETATRKRAPRLDVTTMQVIFYASQAKEKKEEAWEGWGR